MISNLVEHQTSDKWRRREGKVVGLLWLMRQYTDLLRDTARAHRQPHPGTLATCDPVTLWVVKSEHTIMCGEWKQDKIIEELAKIRFRYDFIAARSQISYPNKTIVCLISRYLRCVSVS